jgi:anti-anti-sigma regulatory factor
MKKRKQATGVRHSRTKAHARTKPRAPAAKHARKTRVERHEPARAAVSSAHSKRSRQASTSPAGVFILSADCTVAESAALKSGLLEVLREPAPVTIDIASVQRIDTAGVQLLTAFVRERDSLGLKVEWRGAAPAFTSAARLLGVASVLRLPEPLS